MLSGKSRTFDLIAFCCIISALAFSEASVWCEAESLTVPVAITPHRIVLNAKCEGSLQDIQAIASMVLQSGRSIDDFEAVLIFNEKEVCNTTSARYCAIDDNLLISFDREQIQSNAEEFAGDVVSATVVGSFNLVDSDGSIVTTISFVGCDDSVEILAPRNK